MTYFVIILFEGDSAALPCATFVEAQEVCRSFLNYGKYQSVYIVEN